MKQLLALLHREPVVIIQIVAMVVSLAASFGFSLSAQQTAAVMAFPQLVAALIARSQVTPSNGG